MSDKETAQLWIERLKDPLFQSNITGITVGRQCNGKLRCSNCNRKLNCPNCSSQNAQCNVGVQFSVSRPVGFDDIRYLFEFVEPDPEKRMKGGERVICFADGVRTNLMVHANQLASRIIVTKSGEQRFNPVLDR